MAKYGLFFENSSKQKDWLRESDKTIAVWDTPEEAEKWRKSHTVYPNKYSVKKVTSKIIEEDSKDINT
jgi:hypothetical protein